MTRGESPPTIRTREGNLVSARTADGVTLREARVYTFVTAELLSAPVRVWQHRDMDR